MSTYEAAVCTSLDGPDSIEIQRLPRPVLEAGQVRIAVQAAGVNFPDYLLTRGEYQLKLEPPFVPGMEVAGVIIEAASSDAPPSWTTGTRVIASTRVGGFAEEVVADSDDVFPLPAGFSAEDGATFLVAARTAHHALVDRAHLKAGETVLVLGATGGVGLAAVQLAENLGATVIAIGSDDAKLEVARRAGAAHTINYRDNDLVTAVRERSGHVDIVLDTVGGDLASPALRVLGWEGRYLVVGFASGSIPSFKANRVLLKGASIIGVRAGEAARRDRSKGQRAVADLLSIAHGGGLRPHISHRYDLTDAADALRTLAHREVTGRAVITIESKP